MVSDAPGTALLGLPFPLPTDWGGSPLAECCEFIRDGDWIETKDQGGDEYRLLQISNIGRGNFVETGRFRWITSETFARLRCTAIEEGDVLVARMPEPTGRAWHVGALPWPAVTAVDVAIIRTDRSQLDPKFLSYFLNSGPCLALIDSLTTGTTRRRIRRADIERLEVPLPPLEEQRAIARVLGALDDKIELNRRMSETIEEMARALFRSWFVDFDPVRAKAEGRPSGLPPALDALFPASFEASELGEIPAGWEVIPAGEAMTVYGGSTPSTKEPTYWGGEHCFATPKDLSALQEPILASTARRLTDAGIARIRSGLLPTGTVLLSSRAPIGYLAVTETPVAINQGIAAMVCDGPVGAPYALHWTRSNMPAIETRAGGTTFAEISKSSFREIPFLVPGERIHAAWETLVAPLYYLVASNARHSRSLAEQRDALLPWLMSGEVRVKSGTTKIASAD